MTRSVLNRKYTILGKFREYFSTYNIFPGWSLEQYIFWWKFLEAYCISLFSYIECEHNPNGSSWF